MSGPHLVTLKFQADLSFEQVGLFVGALDDLALSSSFKYDDVQWECLWTLEDAPDVNDLRARLLLARDIHGLPAIDLDSLTSEPLPDTNWLEVSYQGFQPFSVGPFFIYGSHHRDHVEKPLDALTLEIDAATAFGSGEHGTTAGCLLAMEELRTQGFSPQSFLDMGTGSGILAIAAAKLWPQSTGIAVDNDPECIIVTQRHKQFNGVPDAKINAYVSEGFIDNRVQDGAPYNLVIANILASPLIAMAGDLAKATARNGYLILSGLLQTQQDDVMAAYTAQGMTLVRAAARDEWAILTLEHSAG